MLGTYTTNICTKTNKPVTIIDRLSCCTERCQKWKANDETRKNIGALKKHAKEEEARQEIAWKENMGTTRENYRNNITPVISVIFDRRSIIIVIKNDDSSFLLLPFR